IHVGIRQAWLELERVGKVSNRTIHVSLLRSDRTKRIVRVSETRRDPNDCVAPRNGFIETSLPTETESEIGGGLTVIWPEFQSPSVRRLAFVEFALLHKDQTQIVVALNEMGPESHRFAVVRLGVGPLPLGLKD